MPFVYRIFQGGCLACLSANGVDTIPLEPPWDVVGGPTSSPIHATGLRLSDLHEFRGRSEPTVPYDNISVAE